MIIGAYAAIAEPSAAGDLIAGLSADTRVTGLEISSVQLLTQRELVTDVPDGWNSAVTCFPGTMLATLEDPVVGLASTDSAGRARAVEWMARIRDEIASANGGGGSRIDEVFLHSAPRGGDAEALRDSLHQLLSWDWAGATLNVEHCDARRPGHEPQKGFLSLPDELAAIAGLPVGIAVNWARSTIETRSVDGPVQHLEAARSAGALRWLMFSGVAAQDTQYGPAWVDAHLPVTAVESGSLMDTSSMRTAMTAAGSGTRLGLKVTLQPTSLDTAERLRRIGACLDALERSAAVDGDRAAGVFGADH